MKWTLWVRLSCSLMLLGPASLAWGAAKKCPLAIEGNDQMQFSTKELSVDTACTEVALTLKHTGKLPKEAMGHNWVLAKEADVDALVKAGLTAGLANDYVPKDDARVLAHTKVLGGGETTSVTFSTSKLKEGEKYKFFCLFPGHVGIMVGEFKYAKAPSKS